MTSIDSYVSLYVLITPADQVIFRSKKKWYDQIVILHTMSANHLDNQATFGDV